MIRRVIAFSFAAVLFAATASAAPIGFATDTNSNLYSIDFGTGSASLIGAQGVFLEALALSPDGQLYGTDTGGRLYSLNTSTGAATLIGATSLGDIEGLDFNGATLVGTNFSNPTTFSQIDTSTAAASPITTTSSGRVRAFTIQDSNTALAWSDSPSFQTLISVDLTTGAFTNIGSTTAGILGMDFASTATLYGVGTEGALYLIDPLTGAPTLIGDTGNHSWI